MITSFHPPVQDWAPAVSVPRAPARYAGGDPIPGADLLARLTAGPRVEARIAAAREAADAWDSTGTEDVPREPGGAWSAPWQALTRAVLLAAEAGGCYGGGLQSPGAGTARLAGFGALGKGRRQATDGPAWDAAIEAAWRADRDVAHLGGLVVPPGPPDPDSWLAATVVAGYVSPGALASLGDGAAALRAARILAARGDNAALALALALCAEVEAGRAQAAAALRAPVPAPLTIPAGGRLTADHFRAASACAEEVAPWAARLGRDYITQADLDSVWGLALAAAPYLEGALRAAGLFPAEVEYAVEYAPLEVGA